jgi:hypothetical protein
LAREVGAAIIASLTVALLLAVPGVSARPQWYSGDGYDWWADCSDVPDPIEFLPIYNGSDAPGFVDLGRTIVRSGVRWRQLQYTKDKELGVTRVSTGRWYSGMGADQWPPSSLDARRLLETFRVVAFEVDGNRHAVDPSCTFVLATDETTIGFYNAWVRFTEPGLYSLRIIGRQIDDFFFTDALVQSGLSDPLGLEGRRVFLRGESVGYNLDDEFTHAYELNVGKFDALTRAPE